MVLIAKTDTPPKGNKNKGSKKKGWADIGILAVKRFEGMVMVLHHSSTIQPNYQAMMHCGAIRVRLFFPSMTDP